MALCVLTAGWKTAGVNAGSTESGGFIDGLLAIIVDHGLRAESKEEADIVSRRVSEMGWSKFGSFICDCVVWCEWSSYPTMNSADIDTSCRDQMRDCQLRLAKWQAETGSVARSCS